jgi:hypothetical protein
MAAFPAQRGIIGKHLAKPLEIVDVTDGLFLAPGLESISGDAEQVGSGPTREPKRAHGLAPLCGKLERFPNVRENVAFRDTARIAFIDGRAQCGKLRLIASLLAFQGPQSGAHNLTGVFVASAPDLLEHKPVKLVGQIDISGRHDGSFLIDPGLSPSYRN